MNDERVKILNMLQDGKITVEEASTLLEAIAAQTVIGRWKRTAILSLLWKKWSMNLSFHHL